MLKEKITGIVTSVKSSKVGVVAIALGATCLANTSVFAADAAPTIDLNGPFTSAINSTVTNTIGLFSAVIPVALVIFGAKFAWTKGIAFFSKMASK